MKKRHCAWCIALAFLTMLPLACGSGALQINGSGSSFISPILGRWLKDYAAKNPDVRPNYAPSGSSAGIREFIENKVAFAASDAAMTDKEMESVKRGVLLVPLTAGSIVLAYNVEGVTDLSCLETCILTFSWARSRNGTTRAFKSANPDATLPDKNITLCVRSDGSGTTFALTTHLSAISKEWKDSLGIGKTVSWNDKEAKLIASPQNPGVAASIKNTPGTIGYVEYDFARKEKLTAALLQNKAGEFVKSDAASNTAALAAVKLPANFREFVGDPEGKNAYPIVTFSWLLVYKQYDNPKMASAMKGIIRYCLTDGQKISDELGYITLPEAITGPVLKAVDEEIGK